MRYNKASNFGSQQETAQTFQEKTIQTIQETRCFAK
jgi:hypothetical protein